MIYFLYSLLRFCSEFIDCSNDTSWLLIGTFILQIDLLLIKNDQRSCIHLMPRTRTFDYLKILNQSPPERRHPCRQDNPARRKREGADRRAVTPALLSLIQSFVHTSPLTHSPTHLVQEITSVDLANGLGEPVTKYIN